MSDYQDLLTRLDLLIKRHSNLILTREKTDLVLKSLQIIESSLKIASKLEKFHQTSPTTYEIFFNKFTDCVISRIKRTELWDAYVVLSRRFGIPHYTKCEFFKALVSRKGFILKKSGVAYFVPPRPSSRLDCHLLDIEIRLAEKMPVKTPEVSQDLISEFSQLSLSTTSLIEDLPLKTPEMLLNSISNANQVELTTDN